MRDYFTTPITSEDQARTFLWSLDNDGLSFHPEDDPGTIVDGRTGAPTLTPDEVEAIRARMSEVWEWLPDPCGYLLGLTLATDETRADGPPA